MIYYLHTMRGSAQNTRNAKLSSKVYYSFPGINIKKNTVYGLIGHSISLSSTSHGMIQKVLLVDIETLPSAFCLLFLLC